jgi:hypothetical protein
MHDKQPSNIQSTLEREVTPHNLSLHEQATSLRTIQYISKPSSLSLRLHATPQAGKLFLMTLSIVNYLHGHQHSIDKVQQGKKNSGTLKRSETFVMQCGRTECNKEEQGH